MAFDTRPRHDLPATDLADVPAAIHSQLPRRRPGATRTWIRSLVTTIGALTVALVVLLVVEIHEEQAGLRRIGQQAGPEVIATSDLYFALNDMDAQIANVLLVGDATSLGLSRNDALRIYEQRRQQANIDIQRVAAASTDPDTAKTITEILDDLGRYEALTARTVQLDEQNPHPPGKPAPATLAEYRQATDLLATALLPAAHRLTDRHATTLEATYESQRARIQITEAIVIVAGVLLLGILLILQAYLIRRFRRLLNPAIALATVLALVGVTLTAGLLGSEATHLKVAKKDAFDSVLALTQARAISYDANADESRYLVDPQRASRYQQAFLDESQQLVDLTGAGIDSYDSKLAAVIAAYQQDHGAVGWTGLYGTEFRNITFAGERAAAETTLLRYQTYQRDDRHVRALAADGQLGAAIAFCTSYTPGQSNYAFDQYDQALAALITINTNAFNGAVTDGQHELNGWTVGLVGGAITLIALLIAGVWPRLAEYR